MTRMRVKCSCRYILPDYAERADFACHAAFPQMLTTEVVYLLRQWLEDGGILTLHWSAAPELLLSNLCDTAGHDLYGMSVAVRRVLLEKLVDSHLAPVRINL